MKKLETAAKYAAFLLFGVFTADMIFRFTRFTIAYREAAEEFPKIIGVAAAAVGDTYSGYMSVSLLIALILALIGGIYRFFSAHTLIFFGLNIAGGLAFIAVLNFVNVPWRILMTTCIISFGTYIASCVLCEISAACDLYKNFLKLQQGDKSDDSTT